MFAVVPSGTSEEVEEGSAPRARPSVPPFEQVYEEHFDFVWRSARRLGVADEALDDVAQEIFLVVHRKLGEFEGRSSLRTWLYAIARRVSIDLLRRERRPTVGDHEPEVEVAVPGPSFERTWEVHEVRRAIDDLPAEEREVVRLSHLVGMTHPEIAEELGIPVGTVKSRSGRAHKRLAAALRHLAAEPTGTSAEAIANRTSAPNVEGRGTTP